MRPTRLMVVVLCAVFAIGTAGSASVHAGSAEPEAWITIVPDEPKVGELVTIRVHVRSPAPFSRVEAIEVDYGDRGSKASLSSGSSLPCAEAAAAAGSWSTVSTARRYLEAGVYEVSAVATVGQSLCGVRIGPSKTATAYLPIRVGA